MKCFSSFFKKKKASPAKRGVELDEDFSSIENTTLFTYKELCVATENFSPTNKVGEGGFGSVYKGTLKDGTLAAVKVLSSESKQGVREFLNEIKVIAEIEHDNLVKLYGCCVDQKHKILVYGYLENNSLAQTLLGEGHGSIQFNWHTRREICIGIAKGLAFLHGEIQPHIVHRDIKASNVLLDRNLKPKISDFGLAKLFPPNMTHISTRVAGTAGYLAPEYAIRGQLTRKADVYSFGVLVMEIISGRHNTNRKLPAEEQYLLEKAWKLHEKGELVQLVDPTMNGDFNVKEACQYLKVGLLCTQDKPKLRPGMSAVAKMLAGELDVDEEKISRPGLLSEFRGIKVDLGQTSSMDNPDTMDTSDTIEAGNSGDIATSYATMTFTSIYDRSN